MKKLLAFAFFCALLCSSTAIANELSISQDNNTWSVNAVFQKAVDIPTLRIYNADRTGLYYIAEGECVELDEGDYSYRFTSFSFPQSVPSGSYIAVVGGNGTDETTTTFNYANPQDKADALNAIANSTSAQLSNIIIDKAGILGVDNTAYKKLSATWQTYINVNLKKNDYSNDGTIAMANQKSLQFVSDYNTLLNIADTLGSSTTYDWGTVEGALFAFSDTLDTPINFTAYNKLSSTQRASVIRSLKKVNITDYTTLPDKFNTLVKSATSSSSGGSSSFGGGGGGGTQVTGTTANSVYQQTTKPSVSDDIISWLLEVYTLKDKTQTIQTIKGLLNK